MFPRGDLKACFMTDKLKEKDVQALEAMFVEAKGRGFKPVSMRSVVLRRGIASGWISKADSDFFFHKGRGTHIVFTQQGKCALVKRIAQRHAMDEEDALHLVRTGSYHLAETAVRHRRESRDDPGVQTGF